MKRFNLAIIYMLLPAMACSFRKPFTPATLVFPQAGLTYVDPRAAHYIYRDSTTGRQDTVVDTESSLAPRLESINNEEYIGQTYTLELSELDYGITTSWLSGMAVTGLSPGFSLVPFSGSGYLFRYPPCNCGNAGNIRAGFEQTIPFLTVEGLTYTQVVVTINIDAAGQQSSYYWASGVGLIKRVVITPAGTSTFTLVKSY